jgi:hypothetical protein
MPTVSNGPSPLCGISEDSETGLDIPGPSCTGPPSGPPTTGVAVVGGTTKVVVGIAIGVLVGKAADVGVASVTGTLVGVSIGDGIATSIGPAKNLTRTRPPTPSRPNRSVPVSSKAAPMNNLVGFVDVWCSIFFLNLLSYLLFRLLQTVVGEWFVMSSPSLLFHIKESLILA